MHKNGLPVNREEALAKANDIYRAKYDVTWSTRFLTIRWVSCFLKRHPDLSLRDSKAIKRARNEVCEDILREFFSEYLNHVIERNASSDRVFNMDET
uniref:AlNc14C244G9530 protein n=1 Tax=Albugo laibachii Nc14 TaxID=890382 RepID=F0WT46_9STRA|nr:AlNc14C244G9530 [Albugo laibachii Nc14]|eukprot:CCA24533.1 AlNc14C244G9530 [Albugo laibachii Nc14]